jgi:Cu2+-exporting ATPase
VAEARLNLGRSIVRVRFDERAVDLSAVARRLAALGYPPHAMRDGDLERGRRAENRRFLVRIGIAGAIAGNVMLLAFALYGGAFHGMERGFATLFRWVSLGLAVVSLAWPGAVFFRGAIGALRARRMHMDVPVAVGLLAGFAWSAVSTVRGAGDVYFESLTVLVFLLLVGRWVQVRQQRRNADAVALLFTLTPSTARLIEDDAVREVPLEAVARGAIVEVRAGDSIPADGTVVEGSSRLDLGLLTGESAPVAVAPGEPVHAGTTNLGARLLVRVDATGADTRVGRLMQLVEESATRRAPIVQLADRIAGVFVTVVLGLAAVTVALWWPVDPGRAVAHGIALLIITCPCALGLATPLAIVAAVGRAAREGLLIKGGDVIERLGRPGFVLLDKTGTITRGQCTVERWEGPEELHAVVAALEAHSAHPIAGAVRRAYGSGGREAVEAVEETTGAGVAGRANGMAIAIGSRPFMTARGDAVPPWAETFEREVAADAWSPVLVAVDGAVRAAFAVGDPVEPDAAASIAAMRRRGWSVRLLSGDHPRVAEAVAVRVGIDPGDARGGATPEDKLRAVEAAKREGPVMMVGDGVNDAAALAAATVGVAVRGGAEASLTAAHVYASDGGLSALPALLDGARRTVGVIRRNLAVSLGYNVVGTTLAMAGLVDPLVAAVLMPLSSLTVITLSYRARTFGAAPCP